MPFFTMPHLNPLPTFPIPLKVKIFPFTCSGLVFYQKVLPSLLVVPFHSFKNSQACRTILPGNKNASSLPFSLSLSFLRNDFHHLRMILQRLGWAESEQQSMRIQAERLDELPLSGKFPSFQKNKTFDPPVPNYLCDS